MNEDNNTAEAVVLLVLLLIVACMTSCQTPRTVYVDRPTTKIEYRDRVRVDSLVVHDSIYQETIIKGDTVTRYKYFYHDVYRDKLVHDTLAVHDTLSVPFPVEKVVAHMNGWQTFWYWFGLSMFLCVGGYIGYKLWKRFHL